MMPPPFVGVGVGVAAGAVGLAVFRGFAVFGGSATTGVGTTTGMLRGSIAPGWTPPLPTVVMVTFLSPTTVVFARLEGSDRFTRNDPTTTRAITPRTRAVSMVRNPK